MSISSVSATPPVTPAVSNNPPSTPVPGNDKDADDSSSTQPTQAPLPPGQGTRIDQLA